MQELAALQKSRMIGFNASSQDLNESFKRLASSVRIGILLAVAFNQRPQVLISGTFSMTMTRGLTLSAHLTRTHDRPRISFLTGVPPLAREKCVQSGENQAKPMGYPPQKLLGSTANTSSL